MARRRRLEPTKIELDTNTHPDTAPADQPSDFEGAMRRAPIADVARDAATAAALAEVTQELSAAREDGRLIQSLALESIVVDHLKRDRLVLAEDEMTSLCASLSARGQQTPIEVVALGAGTYGLISGLRRIEALRRINAPTVLAIVRRPDSAQDAYVAMVEENEIRAALSFYERAQVAAEATEAGVYTSVERAVQSLFANASPSKRSKVLSFVALHRAVGAELRFPSEIPEKLGLALVKALGAMPKFETRLRDNLRKSPAQTAGEERAALERALSRTKTDVPTPRRSETEDAHVNLKVSRGRVVLSGDGVDEMLIAALKDWLASRGK